MTRSPRPLTALVAEVTDTARQRLLDQVGEASAWLLWVLSGAPGAKGCVVCDLPVRTEGNHVAGWRHGELVVPMCANCHGRFSKGQYVWDSRWEGEARSPALDESLLILGLADMCEGRAHYRGPAYLELADRFRAIYFAEARKVMT